MQRKSTVDRFIEDERSKGSTDQAIKHKLLDAGWQMDIIQHALGERTSESKPSPAQNSISRDFPILKKPLFYAAALALLILIAIFI